MANFPSVTAAGAFESTAVQNAIKALARAEVAADLSRSGLRNLTTFLGVTAGGAYFEAKNGWATLYFNDAVLPGSGTVILTTALQSVAPSTRPAESGLLNSSNAARRIQFNQFGQVRVYGVTAGETLNGSVFYALNRALPVTPPGDPA